MKISNNKIIISLLIGSGILFGGCQTPSEKVADAKEDVAEAKKDLKEVVKDANAEAVKVANAEEWRMFKNDTEIKINDNEVRITELRAKMKKAGKVMDEVYAKKIDNLEERNRNLRQRMSYYENNQSDWESFKREFNHDMDELGQAFKDLAVNNKK